MSNRVDFHCFLYFRSPGKAKVEIAPMNIAPYTLDNLHEAGLLANHEKLKKILKTVLPCSIAVVTVEDQVFVDKSRALVDGSKDDKGFGLVWKVLVSSSNPTSLLKPLLSLGVDPDIPANCGSRPSHACGWYSLRTAAECLFLCRPDMTACDANGNTPLQAACVFKYGVSDSS